MHPLGGRELYRVAWLILGLASGCLLSPRYVLPPPTTFRFFPIASSLLSYYSHSTLPYHLTTYLESRAQHTSRRFPIIFIFYLFLSIVKQNLDLSWKKKKKKNFHFRSPSLSKGNFIPISLCFLTQSTDFPHLTWSWFTFSLLSLSLARIIPPPFGMAPTRQPRRALRLTLDLAF